MSQPKAHFRRSSATNTSRISTAVLLSALLMGVVTFVINRLQPHVVGAEYSIEGQDRTNFFPPLYVQSSGEHVQVQLTLLVPSSSRSVPYDIFTDDCLDSVTIDGNPLDGASLPFCEGTYRVYLSLEPGLHKILIAYRDLGGANGFHFRVAPTSSLSLLWWLALTLTLICLILYIAELRRWTRQTLVILFACMFGAWMRFAYALTTPFFVRSHEWDKHVEYIRVLKNTFALPPAAGGWEFHQPPLYYALMSLWWSFASAMQRPEYAVLLDFRTISFLLSVLAMLGFFRIGRILFRSTMDASLLGLLGALLPGIVFFSSQITNDTLTIVLQIAVVALALRWWTKPTLRLWYGIVIVFSLAFLTKVSALILLPLLLVCAVRGRHFLLQRTLHGILGITVALALTAWLPVMRLWVEPDTSRTVMLGNIDMDTAFRIPSSAESLLSFHPLRVLKKPHESVLTNGISTPLFPEYFFRSAFFGEYGFRDTYRTLCFLILLFGMTLLVYAAFGALMDFRRPGLHALPIAVLTVSIVSAAGLYRMLFPFAPNQDFRFSALLIVPVAYYVLLGIRHSSPILRRLGYSLAWGLVTLESIFLLKIVLQATVLKT